MLSDGEDEDLPELQKQWNSASNPTSESPILMTKRAVNLELR